jgi:polyhydroxybutyrate depolymerase
MNQRLRRKLLSSIVACLALAATLVAVTTATTPATAAGCSTTSTNGTVTKYFWLTGQGFRSYNLRVPTGLTGDSPLLIDLHGFGSNAFFQETTSGWSQVADAEKFIVAYPAGSAWGQAWDLTEGSADVTFLRKVVDHIRATYCVDDDRIHAEGGSFGGMMTQRLLCDAEDVFASGVSTIGAGYDFLGGGCSLSRPVAVGLVNVEQDPLFPTAVSATTRDKWLALNGCSSTGTPETNAYGANAARYADCDGDAEVLWRTYAGTSHAYPTGAALADLHARAWAFLEAHPKP